MGGGCFFPDFGTEYSNSIDLEYGTKIKFVLRVSGDLMISHIWKTQICFSGTGGKYYIGNKKSPVCIVGFQVIKTWFSY